MRDDLLAYYERELTFLRHVGADFADKYPKVANRLVLEPDRCEDPHVERLIEAFAFLAARVHLRIDDDFPEVSEALLSILFPHYVRPIPSMGIAEFHIDASDANLSTGIKVPARSVLYSRPVSGVPCKFQTAHALTMWPIAVTDARWSPTSQVRPEIHAPDAISACRVEITCQGDVTFQKLAIPSLQFHLAGDTNVAHALYELLLNNTTRILIRDPTPGSKIPPVTIPASSLRPMGFREEEALLPSPRRTFIGYRLLQEYFALPERFLFLDIMDLEPLAAFRSKIEMLFLISPFERSERNQILELGVNARAFRFNCSPIVNVFPQTAEPIILTQKRYAYPVIPDVRRRHAMEVFSIEQVYSSNPKQGEVVTYDPFYSLRHLRAQDPRQAYWTATREASNKKGDSGTDVFVSLVDLTGRIAEPDLDTLTVKCICTNRDLPSQLPFGDESGDFELEGSSAVSRGVSLRKPSTTWRPPTGRALLWRQISHLSLNYLSLVEEGKEAFQEILRLYNFTDSIYLDRQINGITKISSRRHFSRVVSEHGVSFVRGTRVELEIDEDQFVGGGVYLFASVVEYFLGLYASLNSFSQLAARTLQRREGLREWPPRAGHRILL